MRLYHLSRLDDETRFRKPDEVNSQSFREFSFHRLLNRIGVPKKKETKELVISYKTEPIREKLKSKIPTKTILRTIMIIHRTVSLSLQYAPTKNFSSIRNKD